jgi:hydroxyacylglutathione hydrolase
MIFTRFYNEPLAQASYLIGCPHSGEAVVVDPIRDVEPYVEAADQAGLRIVAVTETHIHADFVSGARELAAAAGARLHLSDEGGADWKYAYAGPDDARLLRQGDTIRLGEVQLEALHTPGHTPEHLSFLVSDFSIGSSPMGVLTGDFIFVNDVGRPDLLEKAAGIAGTAREAARVLYRSLQQFGAQAEYLQIWPGHGAGSACGKNLSAVPQSSLGYERRFNWAFQITSEDAFVELVLASQPEAPRYFGEMKRINRLGPRILGGFRRPPRIAEHRLPGLLADGALVVDTRSAADFAAGHVPGTVNLPLNASFTTWAGWLLPYDREIYLIAEEHAHAGVDRAVRELALIGLDQVGGYFGVEAPEAWSRSQGPLEAAGQIGLGELTQGLQEGAVWLIDVRTPAEWAAGHIPGARHLPLGNLPDRIDEVPADRPVVLHCQGGSRAAIGASLLQARGRRDVLTFPLGFGGWQGAGQPVIRGQGPE